MLIFFSFIILLPYEYICHCHNNCGDLLAKEFELELTSQKPEKKINNTKNKTLKQFILYFFENK